MSTRPKQPNHAANEAWARVGVALAAKDSHAALWRLRYSTRVSWLVRHFAAQALNPRPTNDRCSVPRNAEWKEHVVAEWEERVVAVREDGSYRVEPDEEPADWRSA